MYCDMRKIFIFVDDLYKEYNKWDANRWGIL